MAGTAGDLSGARSDGDQASARAVPPSSRAGNPSKPDEKDADKSKAAEEAKEDEAQPEVVSYVVATEELLALGGFGPPPSGLLGAPAYALRVRKRQHELRRRLREIHVRLTKCEIRRMRAEAQLGQSAVDHGAFAGEDAEKLTTKFQEAERALATAKDRSAKGAEKHAAAIRRFSEQEEVIKAAIDALSEREAQLVKQLREVETNRRRSDAKVQRAGIEIRNLEMLAAKGGAVASDVAGRRAQMQAEVPRLEQQAKADLAVETSVRLDLGSIRREIEPARNQLDYIDDSRESLIEEYETGLGIRSEESRRAAAWRRARLAAIGKEIFDRVHRPDLPGSARLFAEVERTRADEVEVTRELETYVKAFDVYDRTAVLQARILAASAAGVVVLGLVLSVLLQVL